MKRADADDTWDVLRARIARVPEEATVRGMFLSELIRSAPGMASPRRYIPFSMYPAREYMELILQAASAAKRPDASPATCVLRAGSRVYTTFAASIAGTAIFSIAQLDFRRAIELSPKAYNVTLAPSKVEVVSLSEGAAFVRMRSVWPFPEFFHAGIWLGAMESFGVEGELEVTQHAPSDVDFDLRWTAARR